MPADLSAPEPAPLSASAAPLANGDPRAPVAGKPGVFTVGTLSYTKAGLITLFLWLLWGDFCFTIMEAVVPVLLPVKLNQLSAPNSMIGLIVTTIPGLMNILINPVVSYRSDRHRGKWGRRIPFLVGATPFLVLFLVLLGYSEQIGAWIHGFTGSAEEQLLPVVLITFGVFMVCFQFFNMFVGSVYYYLFNDVVPREFLARFMALFRMVGAAAGALFNFFVFKYATTHLPEIFLGAGLLYLSAFAFMCWKVREGTYPPPEKSEGGDGFVAAARTYAKECFGHRFYWFFYLANTCVAITWTTGAYSFLMARSYGLDAGAYGKFIGILGVVSTLLLYPAGALADKYHPLRLLLGASIGIVCIQPLWFLFFVFDFSPGGAQLLFMAVSAVTAIANTLHGASELPMFMRLLPVDRYGQFSSANSLIRSFGVMLSGVGCGLFIDTMKRHFPEPDFCYRFVPLWTGFFYIGSVTFLILLYRECRRSGWGNHRRV